MKEKTRESLLSVTYDESNNPERLVSLFQSGKRAERVQFELIDDVWTKVERSVCENADPIKDFT